jgi:Bcr/CflA subfamily drug resistance transporter
MIRSKTIGILCLVVTVARFALDSYIPALPKIATYFECTGSNAQLTLTIYLLGLGGSQFFYGPLSDRFGRRKVLLGGLTLFILSGIMCTLAHSLSFLIFSRLLSGIGAGAGSTLSRAIISDIHQDDHDIAKAWGQVTSTIMLSLMIAPIIGGYVEISYGWRYVFLISTVYASCAFLILFLWLPETKLHHDYNALKVKVLIRSYVYLLKNTQFISYIICSTLAFSGVLLYFQLSPFLLIDHIGLLPSTYGWLCLLVAGGYVSAAFIVNRFADKVGVHRLLGIGIMLLILGGSMMLIGKYLGYFNTYSIVFPSVIYITGARIVSANATAGSLSFAKNMSGYTSALAGGLQMIGASLISYLITQFPSRSQLALALVFLSTGGLSNLIFNQVIIKRCVKKQGLSFHTG